MIDSEELERELRAAGAKKREIEALLPIASSLGALKKDQVSERKVRWLAVIKPATYAALGLAIGVLLVTFSQAASPTSLLFPVQKFSDDAVVSLHPQYRATVMMKRAQQVNQLVASHTDTRTVMATLADYTRVAGAYKATPHANYAAFEYCESNLKQASAHASPEVRQAIAESLDSLESS